MRIVISEFISLDGVIQAPGGPEEDTDGGFATRGTFLLDRDGVVQWRMLNGPGDARDFSSYREALAGLRADAARA